jgi:hypothetical protein
MATTNEIDILRLPIPNIQNLLIARRMLIDTWEHWMKDKISNVVLSFFPPNSTDLWPQRIQDIGSTYLDGLLKQAGNDAVGSTLSF